MSVLSRCAHTHTVESTNPYHSIHTHLERFTIFDCGNTPKPPAIVVERSNAPPSSSVHTLPEWKSFHLRHLGDKSKTTSSKQQMAESSAGHVDPQFIAGLRYGLRHRYTAAAHCFAHLLFSWYEISNLSLLTVYYECRRMSVQWGLAATVLSGCSKAAVVTHVACRQFAKLGIKGVV